MMRAASLSLLLAFAGCGTVFKTTQPPVTTYALHPTAAGTLEPPLPFVLVVARPTAAPGLDSDRVAVRLSDRRFEAYAGVRFNGSVPDLVQSALIAELQERGGFRAVLTDRAPFGGHYLLETEVRDFSANYLPGGGPPHIRVELVGTVGTTRGHELLATVSGHGESAATEDHQRAVMMSFEAALTAALAEIEDEAYGVCQAADAPRSPDR